MKTPFDLKNYLKTRRQWVDQALENYLPKAQAWPERLNEAVRYSMFAGGKRLRPILAIAATETLGQSAENTMPAACALEMIHTYSLIHDDLPAMDDDDLRRGQPTNHKVYGEAIAILAGDALLTQAFFNIAHHCQKVPPELTLEILKRIALASGSQGMVGGQVEDLLSEKKQITPEALKFLHQHKTGKLIQVSVETGALMAQASSKAFGRLSEFGECIGLAFQIADDVLDIEGGEAIGKDIGSDLEKEKATYPALLGLEKSKDLAHELTEQALKALAEFDEKADPLREIARYVVYRKN